MSAFQIFNTEDQHTNAFEMLMHFHIFTGHFKCISCNSSSYSKLSSSIHHQQ